MLLSSKIFFQCIFSVPVRVIVDASEGSPQSSLEHYEFRYSPVLEQSSKVCKQRPKKTHEERLESFRERYKILKAENPEYLKEKSRKGYIKRRKDPENLARDQKYFKLYRDSNRAKMNEYQRNYKRRKKEKEQQQDGKGKESYTRKRKGTNGEHDQTAKKKINKQNSKSGDIATQTSLESRKPIIARLKVSSKTIDKLYGPKSPID